MAVPAVLLRDEMRTDVVRGVLAVAGEQFQVLERPWLQNQPNISCIPAGHYRGDFLPRSSSGKYRNVYWLRQVPNRSGILLHNGNLVAHSRGCLIIGKRRGVLSGKPAVLSSRTAMGELTDLLQGEPMELQIINGGAAND